MNLSRLLHLSAEDWCFLLRSIFLLPLIKRRLRKKGFRSFGFRYGSDEFRPAGPRGIQRASNIARIVNKAASCHPMTFSCLERSLLLMRFLKEKQIAGELKIGAFPVPKGSFFAAHAWVEVAGEVVNDDSRKIREMKVFDTERIHVDLSHF